MFKLVAILVSGILIGSFATYHFTRTDVSTRFSQPPERDIDPEAIVELSAAEARQQREDRYGSVKTIADTLALPTDFAETEALYVLAGRSNSEELQDLIYQAIRIKDKTDSNAALAILFLRLVEIDPLSAVAITRSPAFTGERIHERSVWQFWGRLDLEAALVAAQQGSVSQRNVAAQGLYTSLRVDADDKTRRIESVLGIAPDRNSQGQRFYALAAESPALAIEYIETIKSPNEQYDRLRWLAYYLHRTGRDFGEDYSHLIRSPAGRRVFQQTLDSYRMRADPEAALREALAEKKGPGTEQKILEAMLGLAQAEPAKALQFLDQVKNMQSRRMIEQTAATTIARTDPDAALEWARGADASTDQQMLVAVITRIAQEDMQRALLEVQNLADARTRDQVYENIAKQTGTYDPNDALQVIELIEDPDLQRRSVRRIATIWVQSDAERAIDWAMTLPDDARSDVLLGMGQDVVFNDVDAAIAIMERMPEADATNLRYQITLVLAQQRSVEEAQVFVDQFEGTEGHSRMQATVIGSMAATNPGMAMQLAGTIADDKVRDQAIAAIVGNQATVDVQQAIRWLDSISEPSARGTAMAQIAYNWHQTAPSAAVTWIDNLPAGREKDQVLSATVSLRRGSATEVLGVIDSIGDDAIRSSTMLNYFGELARTNPGEARRLLQELDVSDAELDAYRRLLDDPYTIRN